MVPRNSPQSYADGAVPAGEGYLLESFAAGKIRISCLHQSQQFRTLPVTMNAMQEDLPHQQCPCS